jgi:dipeptidyl-peptidase-4
VQRITSGKYDVTRVLAVDEKSRWLYFIASPDNPAQRFLYRIGLDGKGLKRLSLAKQAGSHSYNISPDAQWAVHSFSSFAAPPVSNFIKLAAHKTVRGLESNKGLCEKLGKLKQPATEFFRVKIADDVEVDAYAVLPPDLDKTKKYPLLIYVYGEPAGQTVVDRWGGSGGMWHRMLAQQGYIVMSFDNRGTTAPRGNAWRKCVYRQVGILAAEDQAAAVRQVLKDRPYLDAKRVGVWGWSGGGSMTLNALFKFPDLYHTGISIAPVPNQRLYDTIYQERYMGLPKDNVEGYKNGSPITYAKQLKGKLLLVHGTVDDNVHYQGMAKLIHELVAHNKKFEMIAYPNRTHSIREGKNTVLHLRTVMTDFLKNNLPAGPN